MVQHTGELLEEEEAILLIDSLIGNLEKELEQREEKTRGGYTQEQIYEVEALATAHSLSIAQGVSAVLGRVKRLSSTLLNVITNRVKLYFQRLINFLLKVGAKIKEWSISFTAAASPSATIAITFNP